MKKNGTNRKKRIIIKATGTVLAMPIIAILTTIILLYIPPIQRYAVKKCSELISNHSNYNLQMEKFNLHFPLNITIKNFTLSQQSDTLLQGERLRLNINILPLIKGEIEANYISIDNTTADTYTLINGTRINGRIGHFRTAIRNADLTTEQININQLNLTDSNIKLTFFNNNEPQDSTPPAPAKWIISLKKGKIANVGLDIQLPEDTTTIATHIGTTQIRNLAINLEKNNYRLDKFTLDAGRIKYDQGTQPDSLSPIDHLHISNITLHLQTAEYSPEKINGNIEKLTMSQEPSGINIEKGNLYITSDTTGININKIHLASRNGTTINADATLPLHINNKSKANIKTNLHINKRDLKGLITKEDYESLKPLPDSLLNLAATIYVTTQKVTIDTIEAQIPNIIKLGISGEGNNLADNKKRTINLHFDGKTEETHTPRNTTRQPDSINKQLHISGKASLRNNTYTADATITTSGGTATAQGTYTSTNNSYDAKIKFDKFSPSKLLPGIPLHLLSMNMTLIGKGTNLYSDTTRYNCMVQIDTLQYSDHTLDNIRLNARQDSSTSEIHIKADNPLLQMELSSDTKIQKTNIKNHTKINLQKADIQQLGLSHHPVTAKMKLETHLITDLKNNYHIKATGEELQLDHKGKKHTPGELHLTASTDKDSTRLHLNAGDLNINGNIASGYKKLLESIENIKTLAQKNYQSHDTILNIKKYEELLPETNIHITGKNKNILADYLAINGITYDAVNLICLLDSQKKITARGSIINLEHDKQHLDTLRFALSQDSTTLKYFTGVKSRAIAEGKEKSTFGAALYGTLDNGTLTANYIFRDRNDAIGMKAGLTAKILGNGYLIRFAPTATLFRQPFTFNKKNEIFISRTMKIRGNVELRDTTNSGMNLYALSDSTRPQDITLELFNIDLQTVTKLLPFAPDLAGTLNIDLHYNDTQDGIQLSSDATATNLAYEGTPIGNERLEISYLPKSKKEHLANLTIIHNDNKIAHFNGTLTGDTTTTSGKGELTLSRFPLSIANAFLKETDLSTDGYIEGTMTITNEKNTPTANGYLKFDSAYADLPAFGTTLHLVDDKINVEKNTLKFNNFNIYAKGNTPFKVNGTIDLNTPLNPNFNLRMRANDYEIVNSKRTKNSILYGRMFINLNSRITGTLNTLKINGSTTILGKSDITYVIQDTPLETENNLDGLVTFTNFQDTAKVETETPEYNLGNTEMNITLAIEEGARINADFDQERTSYIELQGEGNLNLTYTDETGMNLTGRYRLSNGQMKYTLPVIPLKTFNINQDSYINWTGDIMNPTLNITAVERIITSVLIDNNTQAVQFDVGIKLTNTLNNIGLNFTLSAPENATVQNQLNSLDAETLNKYALTMLITGAYIGGENNLSVSGALSSFLDAQINNLVGNAMSSTVDINVGITDLEDNTTGDTYKNYSFSFTKRFWNDRLKVIIGGEVNNNANATTNESFINNVSLEWKISNSGNRYLRIFYDKNYESILEGEIIETGIGYIYKRKLNNLNELLIFKKKENTPFPLPAQRRTQSEEKTNKEKEHKQ